MIMPSSWKKTKEIEVVFNKIFHIISTLSSNDYARERSRKIIKRLHDVPSQILTF